MHTILITINGPQRSVDLEVPGEIPVSDLLPALLEVCGPQPLHLPPQSGSSVWTSWGLRSVDSAQMLAPNRTLIEANVLDGAVLLLQNIEPWANQRGRTSGFAPRTIEPQRPDEIGVRWGEGLLS